MAGLTKGDKINLSLLVGGGILLAILSVVFREFLANSLFGFPPGIVSAQYKLMFIFFGVLVISLNEANRAAANYAYIILTIAVGFGMLIPPRFVSTSELMVNVGLLVLTVGGLYYVYNFINPSNLPLIVMTTVLSHEIYLYGVFFCLAAAFDTGQSLYLFGILLLTIVFHGFRSTLADELDKSPVTGSYVDAFKVFLAPQRLVQYI